MGTFLSTLTLTIITTCTAATDEPGCYPDAEILPLSLCLTSQQMIPGIEGLMRMQLAAEGNAEGLTPEEMASVYVDCLPLTVNL